jgi:hypothetical protein
MSVECFMIIPTGRQKLFLRRYRSTSSADDKPCPLPQKYHDAMVDIGEAAEQKSAQGYITAPSVDLYQDDPRWPAQCACGYVFSVTDDNDHWQVFGKSIYRREGTTVEYTLEDAPPGAIWNAWWLGDFHKGPDGQCLICRLPGGHDWNIDGIASNCDSPCARCGKPRHACQCKYPNGYQDSKPHKCWVRHGQPPKLTVDKNGVTCGAGAGSIVVPGWHGFLRNGVLVPC